MNEYGSHVKLPCAEFQKTYWRRSVGPWLSQFESPSASTSVTHSTTTERQGFQRNAQGLRLKERRNKRQKTAAQTDSHNRKRYDPSKDPKIKGNPHKTIFIARLDYSTSEETLTEVFRKYGDISQLRLVRDTKTGKSKGYAFVEFEDEEDAKRAIRMYKQDGLRIDAREVLVDRVRAGVVSSWLPVRLGGGLGQRQKGTQRFAWKLPYFGDPTRVDHKDQFRKKKLWFEHQRRSMKPS